MRLTYDTQTGHGKSYSDIRYRWMGEKLKFISHTTLIGTVSLPICKLFWNLKNLGKQINRVSTMPGKELLIL